MENLQQPILDGIDPEIMDRLVTRRDALRKGASMSGKLAAGLALGSVPVAIAALARDTFAQTPADLVDAIRFAFVLENLENEFYRAVLGTSAVAAQNAVFAGVRAQIPEGVRQSLAQIQKHEAQHVAFLATTLQQLGSTPVAFSAADFDFTGGNGSGTGPFARAGTELDFLLLTAQAFEDTGVRAYKGQAGRLLIPGNATADAVLESAVRIHAVEARHASQIRRIRRRRNPGDGVLRFSGYVLGGGANAAGSSGVANAPAEVVAALNLVYGGGNGPVSRPENNTQHVVFNGTAEVVIDAATLSGTQDIGNAEDRALVASMAFDEALTKEEVLTIVAPFIRNDPARGLP